MLALMRYGHDNASTRMRLLQFLPALKLAGIHVDVKPLWDTRYLAGFYQGRAAGPVYVMNRYLRRIGDALGAILSRKPSYDAVWVDAEMLPYLPGFVEAVLAGAGIPLIADYDDATWVKYSKANPALRGLLGRKIERVIKRARMVIAGNAYIAEHARQAGARDVVILPTVVDPARYPVIPEPAAPPFRVGFIGTPHTASRYLHRIVPALQSAALRVPHLKLVVVGADVRYADIVTECRPWSEQTEGAEVASFHVGMMPLPDEPWERGKCGYKLIQTLACARPVIASPVGVNRTIVLGDDSEHGRLQNTNPAGILAADTSEWAAAIEKLAGDPELRARMGRAGRARVEAAYSLASSAPKLVTALLKLV
jgi:glycosyltransferase involved in cell wall biosynthesis